MLGMGLGVGDSVVSKKIFFVFMSFFVSCKKFGVCRFFFIFYVCFGFFFIRTDGETDFSFSRREGRVGVVDVYLVGYGSWERDRV